MVVLQDTVTYDGQAWKGMHNLLPNVFNAEDTKTEQIINANCLHNSKVQNKNKYILQDEQQNNIRYKVV